MWIPAIPGGELLININSEIFKTKPPLNTKIKMIPKGGRTTASSLLRANPFPRGSCGRQGCIPCAQGGEEGSRGRCYESGIGYSGSCNRCPDESKAAGAEEKDVKNSIYHGESSKSFFRRTTQHHNIYVKKKEKSWMWTHVLEDHQGDIRGDGRSDFTFKVTGKFKDPTTRIADEASRVARDHRQERDTVSGKVFVLITKDEFYPTKGVRVTTTQF
jgi:hypothetical protein